ncbi:MAG: VOC family protein [bacterium]|nr:VOC family protein [bacterium]
MAINRPAAASFTPSTTLPDATRLGLVTLSVANLERSRTFYENVIGLKPLAQNQSEQSSRIVMGIDTPLVALQEKAGASRQPGSTTGLYHIAVLLPTRASLARTILHFAEVRYPLQGYADHRVSEAFYLADPDGHGLEIYWDKPRDQWVFTNDTLDMGSDPIDLDALFAEAGENPPPFNGLPDGTKIGHMHLRVGDSAQAVDFYTRLIGFQIMQSWPGAGFVSAGGYHHHLGLNMWQSRGGHAPSEASVQLEFWTIHVPHTADLEQLVERLAAGGWPYNRDEHSVVVRDPWGTTVHVTTA